MKILLAGLIVAFGFFAGFYLYQPPACSNARHYSYFSTKSFFDTAYDQATSIVADSAVKGIIVNHHLLAANLIAETIGRIATTSTVTVILISPNHFSAGDGPLIASVGEWETPYGILPGDCVLIKQLQARGLLNIDERPSDSYRNLVDAILKPALS